MTNKIKITSLAEAVMAETTLAEFGFTAVSNKELAALRDENERMRAALTAIADEAGRRNTDWCRRKAREGLGEEVEQP